MLLARSVRPGLDDGPMSASRLWFSAGGGIASQPAIVPITIARGIGGAEMARSWMVRLAPLTPIQVAGAWPDADTVTVTGPVSSLQPAPPVPPSGDWPLEENRARPVESVSAWHGSSSAAAPTRTAALDRRLRVSS